MLNSLLTFLPFLISISDKEKRMLVIILLIFIVLFVIVGFIGNGIKRLINKYADGIDEYMYPLGKAKLIKNKKEFKREVLRKETKTLFFSTRWIFRVFILALIGFILYAGIANPSGAESLFYFTKEHFENLRIVWEVPKSKFFFFNSFPVDFPRVIDGPNPVLNLDSIITYTMSVIAIITVVGVLKATLRFMSRVLKAESKASIAFSKKITEGAFVEDEKPISNESK